LGSLFIGLVKFQWNELDAAEEHLAEVVETIQRHRDHRPACHGSLGAFVTVKEKARMPGRCWRPSPSSIWNGSGLNRMDSLLAGQIEHDAGKIG
jgi:hypothetical protein